MARDPFKLQAEVDNFLGKMAMQSRKDKHPVTDPALNERLDRFLEDVSKLNITPQLRAECKLDKAFTILCDTENRGFHFTEQQTTKAKELLSHFQSINWGAPPSPPKQTREESEEQSDGSEDGTSSASKKRVSKGSALGDVQLPPPNHPIWGRHGIMHGIARKRTVDGRITKVLNPALKHEQKSPKVFGHNGLEVGAWFPSQLAALFHGAHGHSQAGIYYNDNGMGAYSIIVSGGYKDLDQDKGDKIWYSGSGSSDNENPREPAPRTKGTEALFASLRTRNLVRVMRAAGGESPYSPTVGIRYDGLYRVVDALTPRNTKRGLYDQFILKRVDGQREPKECKQFPSSTQVRDFHKINDYY